MSDALLIDQLMSIHGGETAGPLCHEAAAILMVQEARIQQQAQEIERLEAALNPVYVLPPGPWEVWTSNSFRRISCDGDGDVLRGTVHSDGHPDLSWNEQQCQALCDLVNGIRAALEEKHE